MSVFFFEKTFMNSKYCENNIVTKSTFLLFLFAIFAFLLRWSLSSLLSLILELLSLLLFLLLLLGVTLVAFPMQKERYDYSGWVPTLVLSDQQRKEKDKERQWRESDRAYMEKLRKEREKVWANDGMLPPA